MANAEIAGTLTGFVLEDAIFRTFGEVFISSGTPDGRFLAGTFDGLYGALTLNAAGGWSYAMNNNLATVQSLAAGTDSHDYFILNWKGGLVQGQLDIVVQGANDRAAFDGDLAGILDASRASSLSGKIEIRDPDAGEKELIQISARRGDAGMLTLAKDGNWIYELYSGQQTVLLEQRKTVIESFELSSKDKTPVSVTITVQPGTTIVNDINTFNGTTENDAIYGESGNDQINGKSGNDTLTGGLGNDILDGGTGEDTARYLSSRSNSTIAKRTDQTFVVFGPEGADILKNIDRLVFSDKSFSLTAPPPPKAPSYGEANGFLFDSVYYLLANPDLPSSISQESALNSYLLTGASEGREPNHWFDAQYYKQKWDDLRGLTIDNSTLFQHYNLYGVWEGRSASPLFDQFDGEAYLSQYTDVADYVDAYINNFLGSRSNGAIAHYVIYGQAEGRAAYDTQGLPIDSGWII